MYFAVSFCNYAATSAMDACRLRNKFAKNRTKQTTSTAANKSVHECPKKRPHTDLHTGAREAELLRKCMRTTSITTGTHEQLKAGTLQTQGHAKLTRKQPCKNM